MACTSCDDRISTSQSARERADWLAIETLLNSYARDLAACALWTRPPAHDAALAEMWQRHPYPQWLRFAFDAAGVDVFCPVTHFSDSGRHCLAAPAVARSRDSGAVRELAFGDIAELVMAQYRAQAPLPERTAERVHARLRESRDNLAAVLEYWEYREYREYREHQQNGQHRSERLPWTGAVWPSFRQAEQAVLVGHPFHPLAKSRWGLSPADVQRYSPELGGEFQLCFFLAHPSLVLEERVGELAAFELLKHELCASITTPAHARALIERHADWRLMPVHPWEAEYLLRDARVAAAMAEGALAYLGPGCAPFTATSSVRTVYRRDLPFMLKLSMHVGITNCERVNHLHELRKGCAVARLLESPWGQRLHSDIPNLGILRDIGFVTLMVDGRPMDGFSTIVRESPFGDDSRVAVAAALCEPPILGQSLLHMLVAQVAEHHGVTLARAAILWFERYLELLLGSVITAYDHHGLALEIHLQNLLVQLDITGLPQRLHYRDNQGFFFRHGRAAEVLRHVPELAGLDPCMLPESLIHEPFGYYLLVNNVLGFVQAFGAQGLGREDELLRVLAARLRAMAATDSTGFTTHLMRARGWPAKGNLRMAFEDRDEATRPVEAPATYIEIDNPILPFQYLCREVVAPQTDDVVHAHFFADYGATMRLRPLSLERDLAMIHDWVNQSYAKTFWCMDGPIRDLEAHYLEMLASPYAHAFIAHLDEQPAFLIETYWAPRDVVGRYYDVRPDDHGFHMLVAPPRIQLPGFTARAFQVALEFMFRHPRVGRVLGEPDHRNLKVAQVMQRTGYHIERVVRLPDKDANLMFCTREDLLRSCPDARPFIAWPEPRGSLRPLELRETAALRE